MQNVIKASWTGVTAYMHGGRKLKALGVPKPYAEALRQMTEQQKAEFRAYNAKTMRNYKKNIRSGKVALRSPLLVKSGVPLIENLEYLRDQAKLQLARGDEPKNVYTRLVKALQKLGLPRGGRERDVSRAYFKTNGLLCLYESVR